MGGIESLAMPDGKVKFSHCDCSVAFLNAHGVLKVHRAGTSVITAEYEGFSASVDVLVECKPICITPLTGLVLVKGVFDLQHKGVETALLGGG